MNMNISPFDPFSYEEEDKDDDTTGPDGDDTTGPDDDGDESKPLIKVAIITADTSPALVRRIKDSSGKWVYSGLSWDIWLHMLPELKKKYRFTYSFFNTSQKDYGDMINAISKGEYDMCISNFFRTGKRHKIVDFSEPLWIDANAVLHKTQVRMHSDIMSVIDKLIKPISLLLLLGIIFGVILFFTDPARTLHSKRLRKSGRLFFIRSIMTGISTMFGEMGYLTERSSLKISGVIATIIIMILAMTILMYLQAKITHVLLTESSNVINEDNIKYSNLLGLEGSVILGILGDYGGTTTPLKNATIKDAVDEYLKNPDKYDGVGLAFTDGYEFTRLHKDLILSKGFGSQPNGWPIRKGLVEFKNLLDESINTMKNKRELKGLCRKWFSSSKDDICIL
jgi:hypothetical protein